MKLIDAKTEGNFYLTDEGKAVLDGLDPKKYCNLVFIFGNARSGKSFMMNRLLTSSGGEPPFKVINTHEPCTRGVDISTYFIPNSQLVEAAGLEETEGNSEQLVGFVDVEGSGDQDATYDTMLALPLLLTGKVVLFNHKGAPTVSDMLERLGVLAKAAEKVQLKQFNEGEGSEEEDRPKAQKFGHLHILFRDFSFTGTQESVLNQIMTEEKVKKTLRKEDDHSYDGAKNAQERNNIRQLLIDNFASINVWLFKQPAKHDDLKVHAELPDHLIDVDFMNNVTELFTVIAEQTMEPSLFNGKPLTGPGLGQLFGQLTKVLNEGVDINVPSVFRAMEIERMYTVENASLSTFTNTVEQMKLSVPCDAQVIEEKLAAALEVLQKSYKDGLAYSSLDAEVTNNQAKLMAKAEGLSKDLRLINAAGAWELVDQLIARETLSFRVTIKKWCYESMPLEDGSKFDEKFEEIGGVHRKIIVDMLQSKIPQVLTDKKFEEKMETAMIPIVNHLEIKKAENATMLKEIQMQKIREEAAAAKAKLMNRNNQLSVEIESTRQKSLLVSSQLQMTEALLTANTKEALRLKEDKLKAEQEIESQRTLLMHVQLEKVKLDEDKELARKELILKESAILQQTQIIHNKEEETRQLKVAMAATEAQLKGDLEQTKREALEQRAAREAEVLREQETIKRKLISDKLAAEEALRGEKELLKQEAEMQKMALLDRQNLIEQEKNELAKQLQEKEEALKVFQKSFQDIQAQQKQSQTDADKKERERLLRVQQEEEYKRQQDEMKYTQQEQLAKLKAREEENEKKKQQLLLLEQEMSFHMEGYLSKKGQVRKNWKRRWFSVTNGQLNYFENNMTKEVKGHLIIDKTTKITPVDPRTTKKHYKHQFRIVTDERFMDCRADDDYEMQNWIRYIESVARGTNKDSTKRS